MPLKVLIKRPQLIILSTAVITCAVVIIFWFTLRPSDSSQTSKNVNTSVVIQPAMAPERVRPGLPVRFKIPSIKVDAAIEHVGRTPEGAMDVPSGPTTVAWFNLGPRPGEVGSAAIAGHFGWKNGLPSIFDELHTLHRGDTVIVEDDQGMTTLYVVRELKTYAANDRPTEVFASNDGLAHMNLITCEGVWSKAKQTYSNRLVVFTDKVL